MTQVFSQKVQVYELPANRLKINTNADPVNVLAQHLQKCFLIYFH